ncbi:serine/threonine-protein kinase TTK/MPS1 [Rhizoctonia solani AG-1 IB]|uniref:Serine/threonine-protein kinase TTK/MPS1 n=1 Tax=Thanatephorus cucumeris (strain AG1-IB / isolate 7/3/14) TaxID=1108050 RepID=M5CEZ6_THACB|nr:serine/threonine-protein kinase TTK/MPS1 [Rhizoctonia solani AG-1 IB]
MGGMQPKRSIDSLRESLRQSFDRPSLDTVRSGLDPILSDLPSDHDQPEDEHGYAGRGRDEGKMLERERERLREVDNRNRADSRGELRDPRAHADRMEREVRPASSLGLLPGTAQGERVLPAKRDRFICKKQEYTVVDCIGRGGSSKVYKVISPNNKIYALKRVRLDSKVDEETMRGYVNEMQLLKRLDGNERIIKLIDSQAVGRGGRYLMMVMELGEIDLAKLLAEKQGTRLQPH